LIDKYLISESSIHATLGCALHTSAMKPALTGLAPYLARFLSEGLGVGRGGIICKTAWYDTVQ